MGIELRLFGHLQVTTQPEGRVLPLRSRAQRLLVYLLLHRQRPLPRENAAFILWPDMPEKDALGALRRALSDLRATLPRPQGSEWVIAARDQLRWNPDSPYWLDIAEFERGIRAGAVADLQQAVALYTADLAPELAEEWLETQREGLRQMQFNALRQLVSHHRAAGERQAALKFARQAAALDAYSETARRDLIAALYEAGDRAAALAEYEHLRAVLHNDLGVAPMAETQALAQAIAQGQPLAAPPPAALHLAPAVSPALPRLVGRESEMETLGELWESAAAGRGRKVIVSGEAGVGKTFLTQHLAAYVNRRGGLALVGHCYEFESVLPFESIVEMLRSLGSRLRQIDLPPAHRSMLARLLPEAADGAAEEPAALPPEDIRAQLFAALLQTFQALAQQQPLLLLFEDIHWAAESTLDWLAYVVPRLSASRLLVAATYRTSEVGLEHALTRLRQRFAREGTVSTLSLRLLTREANRELVAQLSGLSSRQAEPMADRLFAEASGNPFFLQEIIRGLIESGQIVIEGGRWTGAFAEAASTAAVAMPDSLRETINSRVERLSEMTRAFLRAAAVAGSAFDFEVVLRTGGWSEESALGALDDLLARSLVREAEAPGGYAFAHQLVQEAIYASLTGPRRAYWHRRLAETLKEKRPEDYEALAHHFGAAGERALAIEYLRRAAQRCEAVYAYEDASQNLRAALALAERGVPAETRLALLEALADNLRLLRQGPEAIATYQAALDLWRSAGEPDRIMAVRLSRKILQTTTSMWETVDFQQTEIAARASAALRANMAGLLATLEAGPPHPETAHLLKELAVDALVFGSAADWEKALHFAEAAVATAERLAAPAQQSSALTMLAHVYGARGWMRERVGAALQALALSRDPQFDDTRECIRTLLGAGIALLQVGQFARAVPHLEEADRLAEQVRAVHEQNQALSLLEHCWFQLDHWDPMLETEARRRALQRRYPLERMGVACFAIGLSAAVHARRGDFEQARQLREESYAIMTGVSGPPELWKRSHRY